jgi:hypothetical protein
MTQPQKSREKLGSRPHFLGGRKERGVTHLSRPSRKVEARPNIWRVQVKTSTCVRDRRYQLCVQRIIHRRWVAYKKSKLDFVVAYLMPEQAWYVLPMSMIAGRRSLLLAPPGFRGKNRLTQYQEAWHLLGKPTAASSKSAQSYPPLSS